MRLLAWTIQYVATTAIGLGAAYYVATTVSTAVQDSLSRTAQLIEESSR